MANADSVAVIVAGSGETTAVEVSDLLDDFLGDYEDVGLIVPVDKDLYSKTVENAVSWYDEDADVYAINTEGAPLSRKSSKLGGEDGPDKVANFAEVFDDSFEGFDKVYFLTALPEEDDDTFDFYVGLVEAAIDAGIEVKDLSAGLDDIKLADEEAASEENPVEPEPEPEPEKPKRSRRKKAPESDPEPDPEVAAEVAKIEEESPAPALSEDSNDTSAQQALSDLSSVVTFLRKNDEMFALRNLDDEVRYAPITKAAARAFETLSGYVGSNPAAPVGEPTEKPREPQEAPKRGRGRPRTVEPREKQIWDEDGEKWVKRPRGRIAKGTKTRTVNPETDEVLEEGEV